MGINRVSETFFTAEDMEAELHRAGWKRIEVPPNAATVWEAPSGLKYRGLLRCWQMMKAHPELAVVPIHREL